MSEIETFKQEVDRIDTGRPLPDPGEVKSSARRSRRRRPVLAVAVAAGAVAAAAAMVTGVPDGDQSHVVGRTFGGQPAAVPAVGPELGDQMREATEARFPDARLRGEELGDHEVWLREDRIVEPSQHEPVVWDSLYWWKQTYRLPSGVSLTVTAERQAPGAPPATMFVDCAAFGYPSQKSCDYAEVGDLHVAVVDGIRFDDPDFWHREVSVIGGSMEREMPMYTTVHASVDGVKSWAEARALLPDAEAMRDLALDPATHLPEPRFFDAADRR